MRIRDWLRVPSSFLDSFDTLLFYFCFFLKEEDEKQKA